jgi:ABC-type phosphate transport system substrate-binding protein
MPRRSNAGLIFSLLALTILVPRAEAQNGDVAVIVNPNSSITNVSLGDLRKIFAGEKRSWPGGARIKIIVRPPGSHERVVLLRLLGISESEYKQYWAAQVFRGEADAEPVSLPSFGMVKEAAKTFPGAIGFTDARDIKPGMDLKVVKVDGHMPGDPGYPLH